jgi:hypothetical protein
MNVITLARQVVTRLGEMIEEENNLTVCGGDQRNVSIPETDDLVGLVPLSGAVETILETAIDDLHLSNGGLNSLRGKHYLYYAIIGHDKSDDTFIIRVPECISQQDIDEISNQVQQWEEAVVNGHLSIENGSLHYDGNLARSAGLVIYYVLSAHDETRDLAISVKNPLISGKLDALPLDEKVLTVINDAFGTHLQL